MWTWCFPISNICPFRISYNIWPYCNVPMTEFISICCFVNRLLFCWKCHPIGNKFSALLLCICINKTNIDNHFNICRYLSLFDHGREDSVLNTCSIISHLSNIYTRWAKIDFPLNQFMKHIYARPYKQLTIQ